MRENSGPETFHEIEWTPERIQQFWDYFGLRGGAHTVCFSQEMSPAFFSIAGEYINPDRPVLDLGCGPGFLLEYLLGRGIPCGGMDPSPSSIVEVNRRLAGSPGYTGSAVGFLDALPYPDGAAGTLTALEVLEHLDDALLETCWAELARVLAPRGHLILTVPNEEDLESKKIACPECGCVFHRVQHQQSFSVDRIRTLMMGHGLEPVLLAPVNLINYLHTGPRRLIGVARRVVDAFLKRPKVNLVAVCRKP